MARPLSQSLQEHLIPWRELPWPLDWAGVFGREAPLSLEIGFGNGGYLAQQALERPDLNHVGIELSWAGATRLFKRLNKAGSTNAKALLIDAGEHGPGPAPAGAEDEPTTKPKLASSAATSTRSGPVTSTATRDSTTSFQPTPANTSITRRLWGVEANSSPTTLPRCPSRKSNA